MIYVFEFAARATLGFAVMYLSYYYFIAWLGLTTAPMGV